MVLARHHATFADRRGVKLALVRRDLGRQGVQFLRPCFAAGEMVPLLGDVPLGSWAARLGDPGGLFRGLEHVPSI